ncbi:HNH endonuclease family protein [Dapis sp. BLCC M126]|uniref:HNH endonuclease family protein n=1 Tax=Dapis sp. BLCC M126 TaxID=3400189 RepID=UPI003CFAC7ED
MSELWNYEYSQLFETVKQYKNIQPSNLDRNQKNICSLVQLFTFSSYLLKRCCLTVIKPVSQLRAFDMFQSLNATGTPLTAIETFKPLVVNVADSKTQGFKNSNFDKNFTKIENLMERLRSASSKNKRTNEYLTLFSFTYEGKSLLKQFSTQRNWLIEKFDRDCSSNQDEQSLLKDKEKFIEQMGDIAEYCQEILYSQENLKKILPKLNFLDESERKLASFSLLYLKDAKHKMAHTILSRFYSLIIRTQNDSESLEEENQIQAQENFAISCKIVAAFFTLWRSALPTTGLDNVYRKLLQEKMSWKKGNSEMTIGNLKRHFKNALETQEIGTKEKWINKAINYLRYDNVQKVCRFVLFITSHDTISDPEHPGLMKVGKPKSSFPYLEPSQWLSKDLKSIEHIAPQKPELQTEANWDENLYTNDDYEQIGNLTLLPTKINSSAGNKKWIEKLIYYCHLSEKDADKLSDLKNRAEKNKVNLNDTTIKLLTEASCFDHIKPIIEIGPTGKWDKNFVEERTKCICDILWKRMYEEWLS